MSKRLASYNGFGFCNGTFRFLVPLFFFFGPQALELSAVDGLHDIVQLFKECSTCLYFILVGIICVDYMFLLLSLSTYLHVKEFQKFQHKSLYSPESFLWLSTAQFYAISFLSFLWVHRYLLVHFSFSAIL